MRYDFIVHMYAAGCYKSSTMEADQSEYQLTNQIGPYSKFDQSYCDELLNQLKCSK